ncbi:MAG: hypothetical protein BWY63_01245 [Chloroflexi bacterium ADurb.Bin360]|nr:MAG: hypothetical protein BWY63_01245 [Chloroflexi bacterium ADurb.Bin360]
MSGRLCKKVAHTRVFFLPETKTPSAPFWRAQVSNRVVLNATVVVLNYGCTQPLELPNNLSYTRIRAFPGFLKRLFVRAPQG